MDVICFHKIVLLTFELTLLDFVTNFEIFTMVTDGVTDQRTERPIYGWINGWINIPSYTDAIDASEKDDFQKDSAFFQNHYGRTDQWTDGQTNGPTIGRTLL